MNATLEQIQKLADLISAHQKQSLIAEYGEQNWPIHEPNYMAHVHMGRKFARVDLGGSGKYMVDLETRIIYGIKAYGVVHRGYVFGTLDTIADWNWSGYRAHRKDAKTNATPVLA